MRHKQDASLAGTKAWEQTQAILYELRAQNCPVSELWPGGADMTPV